MTVLPSVFADYESKAWPHRWHGTLHVGTIAGGTPTDPKVAEAWLKSKLADKDDLIRDAVAEVMTQRGVTVDEATQIVDTTKHLNGFKRDESGLYIEGRQLKAALREAASVASAAEKIPGGRAYGKFKSGVQSWVAEHVCVVEDRLHLGVEIPTGIMQRFVSTFRGTGIQYEEYVEDAKVDFTVQTDHAFSDEWWAMVWLTGEQQGIGASRSQGFGRYSVVRWERQS